MPRRRRRHAPAAGESGRRRPLSKSELEHWVKLEKTKAEIAKLIAEFHLLLPREKATAIGALYARYSTKHQDSVIDEVRDMLEDAARKKKCCSCLPADVGLARAGVRG